MYKLYTKLTARKAPPSPIELLIATNSCKIDPKEANGYLQSINVPTQNNIQDAFNLQTAVRLNIYQLFSYLTTSV